MSVLRHPPQNHVVRQDHVISDGRDAGAFSDCAQMRLACEGNGGGNVVYKDGIVTQNETAKER